MAACRNLASGDGAAHAAGPLLLQVFAVEGPEEWALRPYNP